MARKITQAAEDARAAALWASESPAAYRTALSHLPSAAAAISPEFATTDEWRRTTLGPSYLATGQVSKSELCRLVDWKHAIGKKRFGNAGLVANNSEGNVNTSSRAALVLARAGDLPRAVSKFHSNLSGVGPATALAALSSAVPALGGYFEDHAARVVLGASSLKYTDAEARTFCEELVAMARTLNAAPGESGWTAEKVQTALWVAAVWEGDKGPAPKRKRST